MCMVSMVSDYGMQTLPPIKWWPDPNTVPQVIPSVKPTVDPDVYKRWLDTLESAKQYDVAAKQPDCPDPVKEQFLKDLVISLKEYGVRLINGDFDNQDVGVEFIELGTRLEDFLKK
jgi:hypothetical protein